MMLSHRHGIRLRQQGRAWKRGLRAGVFVLALLTGACAPVPQRVGFPSEWVPSPNFNDRRANFVVLHHTGDDAVSDALRTLTDPMREVSAHYVIARDGTLYQLVDERHRAWHAGESHWGAHTDLNSSSIGIELDNNGREPYPQAQIESLLALLADLKTRHRIPSANFLGHADIAPGRKVDPGAFFPWRLLAQHGFGLWCDPPLPAAPVGFDTDLALQAFGYDTSNRDGAVQAFKMHFVQDDVRSEMTARDQDLLHCLLQRRAQTGNGG